MLILEEPPAKVGKEKSSSKRQNFAKAKILTKFQHGSGAIPKKKETPRKDGKLEDELNNTASLYSMKDPQRKLGLKH